MHPSITTLVAFCDGEAGEDRSRRIARHLAKCETCRGRLRLIRSEKDGFSAGAVAQGVDTQQGLDEVLSAIANWRRSPSTAGASELRRRVRRHIETYFGFAALSVAERPGMRAEELLGRASEMLDVFLGPAAAEAVRDDALGGLACAGPEEGR
jgi:anti-sigma factor RsiW